MKRIRIEPQTGVGFEVRRGQTFDVIDVEGEQVADLVAFGKGDSRETLSNGRSFDYNRTLYLTRGHVLYSDRSRPFLTILEDGVGRHDFLFSACSPEMFLREYGASDHPNCLDNLTRALTDLGISLVTIPTPFNVFMNARVAPDGEIHIAPPRSKPGDSIRFRAEADLLVAISACSAGTCNNHTWGPIDVEIGEVVSL